MFVHEGIYALTGLQEQAIDTAAWKGARSPFRGMILITVLYIHIYGIPADALADELNVLEMEW
ncbi:MAG: hypothetical protein IJW92_08650 [Clostridia bacterium]|nr:hypothetical protein [Clostridia bacterium]